MLKQIKKFLANVDLILFSATLLLSLIGILTVLGAVDDFGTRTLLMQVAMTGAGMVAIVVIANIDYHLIVDKLWLVMLIGSAALLIITLIFGSTGTNIETTNKSWLEIPIIGMAIQPSEFVKIALVCTFGKHLAMVRNRINHPKTILELAVHAGLIVGLILLSGDLGVALVYMGFLAIMLFSAGLSLWYFGGALVAGVIASPLLWNSLAEYQQKRIIYGFFPELDPLDTGLQSLMSIECIENGGFWGIGMFGKGCYEDLYAAHTDFIFATICEKFGIIGGFAVIILLAIMVIRILIIAKGCGGDYGTYICVGVAAIIVVQSIENIGMSLAMLPVVGITLPFLSCGGSSVLATYVLVALVHSVKAHSLKTRPRGY